MLLVRKKLRNIVDVWQQIRKQASYDIQFYNCWKQPNEKMYWNQFITSRRLLPLGKKVAIFSVFGDRKIIDQVKADVKIFYSAENLHRVDFAPYADCGLGNPSIGLAMGMEVFEDSRYVRFPLWMDYMFPADSSEEAIRAKCAELRCPKVDGKTKYCCTIASHDDWGTREGMLDLLSKIAIVDSAGKWMHNDDSLKNGYGDVKVDYMRQYFFNICPENTSAYGYTTEKLFESIEAGCIPVYWGADFADKAVINENAVIRWDKNNDGKSAIRQIEELWANPKLLEEFIAQPRLLPTAEEYILDTFSTIEKKMRELVSKE